MITNIDSTAIASAENFLKNLPIEQLRELEALTSQRIAEQLADKKQEYGKNTCRKSILQNTQEHG